MKPRHMDNYHFFITVSEDVLPKSFSYKPPVNIEFGRQIAKQNGSSVNPRLPFDVTKIQSYNSTEERNLPMYIEYRHHEAVGRTSHVLSMNKTRRKNTCASQKDIINSQIETTDDKKHAIRQCVSSLLTSHEPHQILTPNEVDAIRTLKADSNIVILPADKDRATVVQNSPRK